MEAILEHKEFHYFFLLPLDLQRWIRETFLSSRDRFCLALTSASNYYHGPDAQWIQQRQAWVTKCATEQRNFLSFDMNDIWLLLDSELLQELVNVCHFPTLWFVLDLDSTDHEFLFPRPIIKVGDGLMVYWIFAQEDKVFIQRWQGTDKALLKEAKEYPPLEASRFPRQYDSPSPRCMPSSWSSLTIESYLFYRLHQAHDCRRVLCRCRRLGRRIDQWFLQTNHPQPTSLFFTLWNMVDILDTSNVLRRDPNRPWLCQFDVYEVDAFPGTVLMHYTWILPYHQEIRLVYTLSASVEIFILEREILNPDLLAEQGRDHWPTKLFERVIHGLARPMDRLRAVQDMAEVLWKTLEEMFQGWKLKI